MGMSPKVVAHRCFTGSRVRSGSSMGQPSQTPLQNGAAPPGMQPFQAGMNGVPAPSAECELGVPTPGQIQSQDRMDPLMASYRNSQTHFQMSSLMRGPDPSAAASSAAFASFTRYTVIPCEFGSAYSLAIAPSWVCRVG